MPPKPKPWYLKTIPELIRGDKPPPTPADGSTGRRIPLDVSSQQVLVDNATGAPYISNAIKSSHYTIADFIPRQIVFQFTRVAHAYLLLVSILQLIPGLSTTGTFTTIIPLIVFIYLLMVKEGYYDYLRHQADVVENNRRVNVLSTGTSPFQPEDSDSQEESAGGFQWNEVTWESVKVGDVVRLSKDDDVPADIVLLHATGENRYAHIDTMALDGETNLKPKAPPANIPNCSTIEKIIACRALLAIEDPNADLYRFDGTITINGETLPVTTDEVVYRGSTIRNTSQVIGLVLNTGEDCKIRMNAEKGLEAKKAATDYITNHIVLWLMLYVLVITTLCSIGYIVWRRNSEKKAWYLDGATVAFAQIWFGFLIMFNQIIPISLYIGLEAVKMGQLVMVISDLTMYHNETNTSAWVNNTNNLDDLGQISYIFTDKTGTLTENIMNLRRISVAGVSWLHRMDIQKEVEGNNEFLRVARENTTEYMIEYIRAKPNSAYSTKATRYIMALALCHTCLPATKEGGEYQYEGSSPDEVALVRAAMQMGFIVTDRSSQFVTIVLPHLRSDQRHQIFQIMDVIQFSSDRKRMSIILKCPDGRIWLICKGADSILLPRLTNAPREMKLQQDITDGQMSQHPWQTDTRNVESGLQNQVSAASDRSYDRDFTEEDFPDDQAILLQDNQAFPTPSRVYDRSDEFLDNVDSISEEDSIRKCFEHVDDYAAEGLRTLIYADKFLSEDEYQDWKRIFREAETSLTDRQQRIEEASEHIETDLDLIGASAVEDKLQDGVPETIEDLRRANIKIFMLTGDKRQTAINIAHSARICTKASSVCVLDVTRGDLESQIQSILDQAQIRTENKPVHTVVVIDGHTLSAIQDPYAVHLIKLFCQLVPLVDSVICCRASPAQKALLVSMVHDGPDPDAKKSYWDQIRGERKPLTLAIGDGANDVSMILTATVGVGVAGREGQQAARVADFSIAQFRYLSRLLLVHGHYNYHRVTMFILTTFWRELYTYTPQAFYQLKAGATGTSLYHPPSLMFISFFTAASMVVIGSYEQVLSPKTLLAIPELYAYGQRAEGLNTRSLLTWVLNSLVAGAVTFFASWASYSGAETIEDNGLFAQSSVAFVVCIIWINYKVMILEMHHKTTIVMWAVLLSILGLWIYEIVTAMVTDPSISHYAPRKGFITGFGRDVHWWLSVIWTLGLLVLMESVIHGFQQNAMVRALFNKCWPQGSKARNGGGVREGFSDWETRLWQEMEQDPAVERLLTPTTKE